MRRRSPRFSHPVFVNSSQVLSSLREEVTQASDVRVLALQNPLLDTQANAVMSIVAKPLSSLSGVINVQGQYPYLVTVPSPTKQSELLIRNVGATIGYRTYDYQQTGTRSERYCKTWSSWNPNHCVETSYRSVPVYGYVWNNRSVGVSASPTAPTTHSLTSQFSVPLSNEVHFKLTSSYSNLRSVTITFQARHTQYFAQGEYKVYLLVNGQLRTLAATIDSRYHHISDGSAWRSFSVSMPGDIETYMQHTYTLEFVRTV